MPAKRYNSPKIKKSKGIELFTTIWMIPFIAMIMALWLAFQYYSKVGPLVTITFEKNAGLVAKQSHVKLRNVIVGTVETVSLSEEGDGVSVTVRMNKDVSAYLNKSAKFWIVHPDVDSSGVTGLDTLLSGSYIEVKAQKSSKTKTYFVGLEEAPAEDAKGKIYVLSAPKSYHLRKNANVYYRMIKVGKVQHVGLAPNGERVNFMIFVYDKYTKYINEHSQFYTTSTVSVDLSNGKLDLKVASLSQIARGGISIYTPTQSLRQENNLSLAKNHLFPLYKNLNEMKAKHLMRGENDKVYKFRFHESISKLEIGSPIEFKSFQVGYVIDISSHFNNKSKKIESVVYAIIHTKGFSGENNSKEGEEILTSLVNDGLKAQLNTKLPLIGSEYIELVFKKNNHNHFVKDGDFSLFPTIEKVKSSNILKEVEALVLKVKNLKFEKLLDSATTLLDQNQKPISDILLGFKESVNKLNRTLESYDRVAQNLENLSNQEALQELPNNLELTLNELTETLKQVQKLSEDYNGDSRFSSELSLTMRELSETLASMKEVSKTLERKSNALILGDD